MTKSRVSLAAIAAVVLGVAAAAWWWRASPQARSGAETGATATVQRGTFARTIRATGTVEAVRAATAIAPRLQGQTALQLVVTRLVAGGTRVRPGDILVEFDRQDQITAALDRRAEFLDLQQQIQRTEAEQAAARATDDTQVQQAENDVARAKIEVAKNRILPRIDAEKNDLALEQAEARLAQLRAGTLLRKRAAESELRILQIRRDRAERAMTNAEQNARLMSISAPFEGLAVVKTTYKSSQMAEVAEGDQVRAGTPVVDVVDPARMRVRARINQADGGLVKVGQPARIQLDAYPGLEFDGRVEEVAPLALQSSMTPKVRSFEAVISIASAHEHLLPDLSAAVDITVTREDGALILPREAVGRDADGAFVLLRRGRSFERQSIAIAAASYRAVAVASGVSEGAVVAARVR